METQMAAKDFTADQNVILVAALEMYVASYKRRVVAEQDPDAAAVWQKKVDAANVLISKIRLV